MTTDDPYLVLGVARDCSTDELKSAYRRLARDNHPDVARDKTHANLRMTQINAAWSQIGDPQKRSAFDARWRLDELNRVEAQGRFARQHTAKPQAAPASSKPKPRPTRASSPSSKPATTPRPKTVGTPTEGVKAAPKRPSSSASANRHARLAEASRLLFKQNKPNEALELCKAILKTDFRNIPARELMGEAYLRLGQTDRALAVWEQALVLSPANVTLRRRWLSLMSPEARAAHERKVASPRKPPVAVNLPRPNVSPAKPGLLSRLVLKLKGR